MLNTVVPAQWGGPIVKSSRQRVMEAYDRLPHAVRKAIREARFSWSPISAEDLIRRYRVSPEDVVQQIREDDAAEAARHRRMLEGKK